MIRAVLRAALAASLLLVSPVFAHNGTTHFGNLDISGAFARATLPNAPVGGGFLTITNKGTAPDRLVSVSATVSAAVQIHEMAMQGDVMKMSERPDGIEIPPGQTVTLAPGGLHIMFMGLTRPFVEGQTVPVTLTFEQAGSVAVELAVMGAAADAAPVHTDH